MQIPASRIVAAIFLELAFTAEIRVMLSQQSAPGEITLTLLPQISFSVSPVEGGGGGGEIVGDKMLKL